MSSNRHAAVFLDRDGTLIEQVHHLNRIDQVSLLPDAWDALRRLHEGGYRLMVVTNQSVIGRGMLTEEGLEEIHQEMKRQLAEYNVAIDAIYHCPIAPVLSDQRIIEHPDRKPGPGMLVRAAAEHHLDLTRSWMIGDMISDLLAGRNAGVRGTIGVRTGYGGRLEQGDPAIDYIVDDLAAAADVILGKGERAESEEHRAEG